MEHEKQLYPMRMCSIVDEYVWGSDEFKLADLGYRDSLVHDGWLAGNSLSEVMDTYMDRVTGDRVFEWYGRQFPFQVKYIHVTGRKPLIVHPDAETAQQRYDFLGREKMWYILDAGKDARLYLGFKGGTDADKFYSACVDGSVEDLLNVQIPHAGDCFHIKPGTVHAASGRMTIIEISESSPLDFCLCAWGQTVGEEEFDESLNLVDALDFIDFGPYRNEMTADAQNAGPGSGQAATGEPVKRLLRLKEFTASLVDLTNPLHVFSEQADSFVVYTCIKGKAAVRIRESGSEMAAERASADSEGTDYHVAVGDTILIPSECYDYMLIPLDDGTVLLESIVEPRTEADPYINPDASPEV